MSSGRFIYALVPRHTKPKRCASSPAEAHTDMQQMLELFEKFLCFVEKIEKKTEQHIADVGSVLGKESARSRTHVIDYSLFCCGRGCSHSHHVQINGGFSIVACAEGGWRTREA